MWIDKVEVGAKFFYILFLYARVAVVHIPKPSLRKRGGEGEKQL